MSFNNIPAKMRKFFYLKDRKAKMQKDYDVFISYNWDVKPQVLKLYEELKKYDLKVWIDEYEMGPTRLTEGNFYCFLNFYSY